MLPWVISFLFIFVRPIFAQNRKVILNAKKELIFSPLFSVVPNTKKKNDLVSHFGNHDIVSWLPFSCVMFDF